MKKNLLILICYLISVTTYSQNSSKLWEKTATAVTPTPANGYAWFTPTSSNNTSCAYNPVTDKLYVVDRSNEIYIINPSNGAQVGTLNKTGITGSNIFQKVRVTATGEIYAVQLKTGTSNGNTNIFYWSSETATPVLCGNATTGVTLSSERIGDSFALSGSGQNVVLYLGGNAATPTKLHRVIKTGPNTTDYAAATTITVATSAARVGISPVTTGINSSIWISGPGIQKKFIGSDGTEIKTVSGTSLSNGSYTAPNTISSKFCAIEYFEVGPKKYLAASGANDSPFTGEGIALMVFDITNYNAITLVESAKLSNTYNTNGNATGDIAIKKVVGNNGNTTLTFFQLNTNNGLAAHELVFNTTTGVLPVSLSSFNASLLNSVSTLSWSTASESNNAGFEVESSTDGKAFTKIGFVPSKGLNNNSTQHLVYSFEDKQAAKGVTYYRLKQLDLDGKYTYSEIKAINNNFKGGSLFSVYPNPTTDFVNIDTRVLDLKGYESILFNAQGQRISTQQLYLNNRLDISNLEPNIYVLNIIKNNVTVQSLRIKKQ